MDSEPGLADVLKETATLDEALLEVPGLSNLSILPAGALRGSAGELICSETMQQVLQELRQPKVAVMLALAGLSTLKLR